uniref:DNA terminal protein n=1 Tax=Lygus hesperus TaxID=30085 RepID=A0A0A9XGQ5_LYGHE
MSTQLQKNLLLWYVQPLLRSAVSAPVRVPTPTHTATLGGGIHATSTTESSDVVVEAGWHIGQWGPEKQSYNRRGTGACGFNYQGQRWGHYGTGDTNNLAGEHPCEGL